MQWLNYSTKGGGSLFSRETETWLEICIQQLACVMSCLLINEYLIWFWFHLIRVYQLLKTFYACIRIILHPLKYHIIKSSNRKMTQCPGAHATARWSLPAVEHWTVRIPCLTLVDSNRKVPDQYFKVVDPKLQVADLKAEVGGAEIRRDPPNLTPGMAGHYWICSVLVTRL